MVNKYFSLFFDGQWGTSPKMANRFFLCNCVLKLFAYMAVISATCDVYFSCVFFFCV